MAFKKKICSQCESDDAFMEWLKEVIGDCAYKEHASNLDMDEVLASKEASTYEGKCFRSCIGETTGIVSSIYVLQQINSNYASFSFV